MALVCLDYKRQRGYSLCTSSVVYLDHGSMVTSDESPETRVDDQLFNHGLV